jgi:hypothetical protein
MAKTKKITKQLRELRVEAAAAVLLVRRFAPHLLRELFAQLALGNRVRRRFSPPKRRTSRPLKVGVSAVGVVAAGVVAARLAGHHGTGGDNRPETDHP